MTTRTLKEKLQTRTPEHKWRPGHRDTSISIYLSIYIYKNKLSVKWRHVSVSTDVMFVDWRNYTPGHRDTNDDRDIGNINDDRDTQRESDRDTRNVRLAITINKAPGHKWRSHYDYPSREIRLFYISSSSLFFFEMILERAALALSLQILVLQNFK